MAKIPVIVVLPKQEPLLESATAALAGEMKLDIGRIAYVPKEVTLLENLPAVSAGVRRGAEMKLESFSPQNAQVFAVRGEIEEGDLDKVDKDLEGGVEVIASPLIEPFPLRPNDPPVGTADDVAKALDIKTLHLNGLTGKKVAVAIMDTGFNHDFLSKNFAAVKFDAGNSWINPETPGLLPGNQVVGNGFRHGTMCAWNVLKIAPEATLLDYPILAGTPLLAGREIARTLMSALSAYTHLANLWSVGFAPGQLGTKYESLVINNSWGMYTLQWDFPPGHRGRYADNPVHHFTQQMRILAANGVDIVFAAGNCGDASPDGKCDATTGTIRGANAMPDVLTLAGCDTQKHWVGYSSQGPSIAKMYQDKPDLAAYTHFEGSKLGGAGTADNGTSTACPVAAGCIAALRTGRPPTSESPANMIAQLRATAHKPADMGGNAKDKNFGYGIIDPVSAARSWGMI